MELRLFDVIVLHNLSLQGTNQVNISASATVYLETLNYDNKST